MKSKIILSTALMAAVMTPASAFAGDDLSVSVTVDYVTDYVFRGVSLADTAIQPGVEVAMGDFSVGGWFSTGIGDTSNFALDEFDLYASYGFALSDAISASVGATYYHYPEFGSFLSEDDGAAGTYEVSAGLGFDTVLSPEVTAYYDLTLENLTLEGGISHSIPMSDVTSLDLGATAGLVDGDGFSYEYGQLSASVGYAFTDDVSAYVGANFAVNSEDALNFSKGLTGNPKDSLFFFGTGISAGF